MAAAFIGGSVGGVTFNTTHGVNAGSWSMRGSQAVDDGTRYSASGCASERYGSGTVDYNGSVRGVLMSGATGPNIDGITGGGGTCTFTAASSCTFSGIFIVSDFEVSHSRRAGTQPCSFSVANAGAVAEAWAEA